MLVAKKVASDLKLEKGFRLGNIFLLVCLVIQRL